MPTDHPRQLSFDLGTRAAYGREDFFVSDCNAQAIAWIDRWREWPAPMLVLVGDAGCGKTHLAQVFKDHTAGRALIWDDIDQRLGDAATAAETEHALFHAYNAFAETGQPILLTAATPPQAWPLTLPDLRSRIMAAPCVTVGTPDDVLILAVMAKMFADRQLSVPQDVLTYLAKRIDRSFRALGVYVAAIDRAALARQRAVTVPLVREILAAIAID